MEIRKLDGGEAEKLAALYMNAYRVDRKTVEKWISLVDFANTRAFVDSSRAYSAIQVIPFRAVIGGNEVTMGGIGGVATWSDQQGRGYAGKLMEYSVGEMRKLGMAISFLFPFSYRYYGKFGWAMAAKRIGYRGFRGAHIQPQATEARVRAALTEADHGKLRLVYSAGLQQYNGLLVRDERLWDAKLKWFNEDRIQPYLIESGSKPIGYFVAEDVVETPKDWLFETRISDYVCLTDDAYAAMFEFLRCLPTNVGKVLIDAPDQPDLWKFFREPKNGLETLQQGNFQARVIDVGPACVARGYPVDVSQRVSFAIKDEQAPWNRGPWQLSVEGGRGTIEQSNGAPELEFTVQEFSAIYMGFQDPVPFGEPAAGPLQAMRAMFHDKPTRILNFF